MDNATVALSVCAGYLLLTLALGIIPAMRVSHSVTGYVAADRAMNVVVLYFVLGLPFFPPSPFWARRGGRTPAARRRFISSPTAWSEWFPCTFSGRAPDGWGSVSAS